jgi:hypothetical protein
MTDNRTLTRSFCADLVYLDWKDTFGRGFECAAVLEDISPRGACLQVEAPVPVNIEATVRHNGLWTAHCRVTYCIFREIGYFVGIEFVDSEHWSRLEFHPQHLLDFEELVGEVS